LRETVAKLEVAGVRTVTFDPYKHDVAWEISSALYFPDGAAAQKNVLAEAGETLLPLTEWAFGISQGPLTITENWHWNIQREKYRTEYHEAMKAKGVDVILCPVYVGVAPEHDTAQYWNYTSVWNILDFPACAFPFGSVVDPELDKPEYDYKYRNEQDKREWEKCEYFMPLQQLFHLIFLKIARRVFLGLRSGFRLLERDTTTRRFLRQLV
jgi:hypothetical protein